MFLLSYSCLLISLLDYSNGQVIKNPNTASAPYRKFDLGGILGQLFPGFNQGVQGGSDGNPGGIGFPSNSLSYPGAGGTTQPNVPNRPLSNGNGQGSVNWPIIDDASQYPSQGQNPGNNFGIGMPTQNPNYNQYPSQATGTGGGYPQTQYPGQSNGGQYPNGLPNQYPGFLNPGNVGQGSQYPNQYPGFFGKPGITGQVPQQNQYPGNTIPGNPGNIGSPINQGGLGWNQNGQNFGPGGHNNDGTLDSLVPPQPDEEYPQSGEFQSNHNDGQQGREQNTGGGSGTNAILGRPVVVPTDKNPEESISFPKSTESPSQKQCVQDCQSTTEYSPVCGTDNVTYFNSGRFICARNCGINVFVQKQGRCDSDL